MLTKRVKQQREEEEARVEAEEVARAAEHFKNVGSDLNEWEEKYGNGGARSPSSGGDGHRQSGYDLDNDRASVLLPALPFSERDQRPGRTSSTASLLQRHDRYEPLSLNSHSPTSVNQTPTTLNFTGGEELLAFDAGPRATAGLPVDAELESKLKLLEEVKRARESVHSSLEKIRAGTPTTISQGLPSPTPSATLAHARTPSSVGMSDGMRSRRGSTSSSRMLDTIDKPRVASQAEWDEYVRSRHVASPPPTQTAGLPTSAAMVDRGTSRHSQYALVSDSVAKALDRRERTISMMEPQVAEDWGPRETLDNAPAHVSMGRRAMSFHDMPLASPVSALLPRDRSSYSTGQRQIVGSAAGNHHGSSSIQHSRSAQGRTMTYEELSERHRQRLSALQEPVTARIREPIDIASAKADWEKQKRTEREVMKRREAEKMNQAHARERRGPNVDKKEILKSTDEWRRSVHGGLDGFAVPQLPAHARTTQPGGSGTKRPSLSQRPSSYFAN